MAAEFSPLETSLGIIHHLFERKTELMHKISHSEAVILYICEQNIINLTWCCRLTQNRHPGKHNVTAFSRNSQCRDYLVRRNKQKECKRKAAVRAALKDMVHAVVLQPIVQASFLF